MLLLSLKSVEEKLKCKNFTRTHKSYIVSISKIDTLESHVLGIGSNKIPISRNYSKEVKEKVVQGKLWRNDSKS